MRINNFEELDIWKLSRELCREIKSITEKGSFSKDYKFRDQIRSSSVSIMDNIAEGFERDGSKEFIQFLSIAKGSCGELRSQVHRAFDFEYIDQSQCLKLIETCRDISKKIGNLMNYLKKSDFKGLKFKKEIKGDSGLKLIHD